MKTRILTIIAFFITLQIFAQSYSINQGGSVSTCGGTFYDSGGSTVDYQTSEDYTMTFCSATPGEQIIFTFTSFRTESSYDKLFIYNGTNTSSPLIGTKMGSLSSFVISSTNGCLTFRFTSDGSSNYSGWAATISCGTPPPPPVDSSNCMYATPFCNGIPVNYEAATDVDSEFGDGTDVGCLYDTPNPTYFYIKVGTAGNIPIHIQSQDGSGTENDVDFICWGPFADPTANCIAGLTTTSTTDHPTSPPGNIIDCSFSAAAEEDCTIPNAQVGEFYLLLLTNYENVSSTISFDQIGGTGASDCSVVTPLCEITTLTAAPTTCNSSTSTYSISGDVTFIAPAVSGTFIVSDDNGHSQTFTPPFASPIFFNLTGINADGLVHNITASFSDSASCTKTISITAPAPCFPCPATASISGTQTICSGASADLTITCQGVAPWSLTYTINGSNPQVVTIPSSPFTLTVNPSITSTYALTAINDANCTGITSGSVTVTIEPVASISITPSNPSICNGITQQLDVVGSVSGSNYAWGNDPTLSANNISNPIATPTITTTYYVTATSPTGCIAIDSVLITVTNIPTSLFTVISPVCQGVNSQINYTGDAINSATYVWTFDGGTVSSGSDQGPYQVNWNTPGDHTVTLQVTQNGCSSTTESQTVTVNPNPTATFTTLSPICIMDSTIITYIGNASPAANYTWDFNGGTIINGNGSGPYTIKWNSSGLYDISLSVTENNCTSAPFNNQVLVHPKPTSDFSLVTPVCVGIPSLVSYNGNPSTTATYNYWFQNSGSSTGSGIGSWDVSWNLDGDYFVSLVVTENGCVSDTTVKTITIMPNPQVAFTSDITNGCTPLDVQFLSQSNNVVLTNWNFGDLLSNDNTSNSNNPSHNYSVPGTYDVTLNILDSNGCVSTLTKVDYITSHPLPTADFTFRPSIPTSIDLDVFFISNNSTGIITSWNWDFGDYLNPTGDSSNIKNPIYHYSGIGSYDVNLIVTTDKGCKDTVEKNVLVKEISTFYIPSAFTPNQDGKNESFGPSGIQLDSTNYQLAIYNRWGQLVFESDKLDKRWDGTYFGSGNLCHDGVYNWVIIVGEIDGLQQKYSGVVTVLR